MGAPLYTLLPKPFQESEVAGAGLPPEGTHLSPGDSRACSPSCLLLSSDARPRECLQTFSLFSGAQCIMAEKINKCLKPCPLLMKASANASTPTPTPAQAH